jgi:general stress protein 26
LLAQPINTRSIHSMNTPEDAGHDKLWHMIKGIRFGMLTTRDSSGVLRSRPLMTQNRSLDEEDGSALTLWFFVSRTSDVAEEVRGDGVVHLAYADPGDDRYVSISGRAECVEDAQRVQALWSVPAKAWFPGGPTDPDLQLIGVRIEHAEYWDVKSSKMMQLLKMAAAAATGHRPSGMAEHREVSDACGVPRKRGNQRWPLKLSHRVPKAVHLRVRHHCEAPAWTTWLTPMPGGR